MVSSCSPGIHGFPGFGTRAHPSPAWPPSISPCAPLWLHRTTSSSLIPSFLHFQVWSSQKPCLRSVEHFCIISAYWNVSHLQILGQHTPRTSFPFSLATSTVRTFHLALGLLCLLLRSFAGLCPSLKCKHLESRTVPYSAFYLSPPLKCLLNSSEKTETGTHRNFLYRAVNVWPAWSPWPLERYLIKGQKDTPSPKDTN